MASVLPVSEEQNIASSITPPMPHPPHDSQIKYTNRTDLDRKILATKKKCDSLSDDMAKQTIRTVFGNLRLREDRPSQSYSVRTLCLSYLKPIVKLVTEWPPYLPPDALSKDLEGEAFRAFRLTLRPTLEFGAIAESRQAALGTLFGLINSDAVIPIRKYLAGDKALLRGIGNSIVSGCLRNTNPLKLPQEVLAAPADAPDKAEPHICWVSNTAMGLQAFTLFALDNPQDVYDLWTEFNSGSPLSTLNSVGAMAMMGATEENPIEGMLGGKRLDLKSPGIQPIIQSLMLMMDTPTSGGLPTFLAESTGGLERFRSRVEEFAKGLEVPGEYDNRPFAVCFDCGIVFNGEPARSMQACSGCKLVTYCDSECQKSHWKSHKKACRAFTSLV